MDYKIIVLDLDGTLTNRDKIITPRTKEALMNAQEAGNVVVLASGRPRPAWSRWQGSWSCHVSAAISCPITAE